MPRSIPVAIFATAVAALAVLPAASASEPQARESAARVVTIKNIAFMPSKIAVRKGTKVTWRFRDGLTFHNVSSRGTRRFRSSKDQRSGSYGVRFKRAGRYRYHCTLHLGMSGVVVVR